MNTFVSNKDVQAKENVVAGIVGAFLFSLAGAVIYFLLHLIGYIASISGFVGAVCAVKGYAIFAKKESKKGIVLATVMSLLVIVMAWYFCMAYDIYEAYKLGFKIGEVDFSLTFLESVRAVPVYLEDPEIGLAYWGDLAIGLVFCLLGCGGYVISKLKNAKKSAETPFMEVAEPVAEQPAEKAEEIKDEVNEVVAVAEVAEETVDEAPVEELNS